MKTGDDLVYALVFPTDADLESCFPLQTNNKESFGVLFLLPRFSQNDIEILAVMPVVLIFYVEITPKEEP